MLFVNNDWLNLSLDVNDSPAQHKQFIREYQEFLKECEYFKFPVVLKTRRSSPKLNKSGQAEPTPSDSLSMKSTVQGKNGTETWVFQKTFPTKKTNGEHNFRDTYEWVRGNMLIHENQKDKLFYMLKKSPYVRTGILFHYDPEMIAKKKAEKMKLETDVQSLIYSDKSPLVQDREKMRVVAKSFGVPKVDKMSIAEIQEALLNKVRQGDDINTKGMKTFIEACNLDDEIHDLAMYQDAVDMGVVRYNPRTKQWAFVGKGGKDSSVICQVESKGNELRVLARHLKTDETNYNRILVAMKSGKLINVNPEDVDGLGWEELKKHCQVAGIKCVGRKKEDAADELREYLINQ